MDDVRRQFETNVFGLNADVPAGASGHARPALRANREHQLDGRQLHLRAAASAAKYAVEAISDALRFEVKASALTWW